MTAVAIATKQLASRGARAGDPRPDRPRRPSHLRSRASLQAPLGRAQRRIAAGAPRRARAPRADRERDPLPAYRARPRAAPRRLRAAAALRHRDPLGGALMNAREIPAGVSIVASRRRDPAGRRPAGGHRASPRTRLGEDRVRTALAELFSGGVVGHNPGSGSGGSWHERSETGSIERSMPVATPACRSSTRTTAPAGCRATGRARPSGVSQVIWPYERRCQIHGPRDGDTSWRHSRALQAASAPRLQSLVN